ncbi:protein asteroid homolog 1-like [Mercenaria mercenaria]|uniref:protein asteroid homolog 1-like n=1 Tax=Mercenaria mercenaria TaxID=6596 RepID=UPI00234EF72A|nr:protein asteroid homolog 1-like [Mercenaria mercenaria]
MGVRGLSTFIDDNKNIFLSDHKLHDTKVIIDGSNLFHFLYYHYKISHQFGGDYDHFARKCKRFFNILKECNITPYVVFDGGYDPDDRKLPEVLDRMNDRRKKVGLICAKGRGCVLPILTYETFRQVLLELQIAHASCVFEADREIAVLAKRWNCPVLSNDSDFYIYRLEGGFVPLDYINMTLCLYNTKTEVASVLDRNKSAGENEFVYIPVKYYNCERLLKQFKKDDDDYVLPMLATVVGNDYVDNSVLYSFNYALRAPKNPSKKSFSLKTSGRMEAVLHWIDTTDGETEAFEQILASITVEKRDKVREILAAAIKEYKDIENFASFDLENILHTHQNGKIVHEEDCEINEKEDVSVSELTDYNGRKLPAWFVKRLRNCELNGSFLQNVSINHRVILNCQVEILRETSSYACSRRLRSFIYGIVLSPLKSDDTEKMNRDSSIVEYDRQGKDTKKFHVSPENSVSNVLEIPTLEKMPSLSKVERQKLLHAACNVSPVCLDDKVDEASQSFIFVLSTWVKFAQPKVTESHLSALIIGVIALHMKELDWLDMKKALGFKPYEPELFPDIVKACRAMPERKAEFFKKHTEKHFSRPEHSAKIPRDNKVVHGFAQFQTCFLDTHYLNQVLLNPVCMPSPSMILNCTFSYNLCRDLESRLHEELYCADILGRGSSLHTLFLSWKQAVIDLCKESCFEDSGAGIKKKNKSKSKVKKTVKDRGVEKKDECIVSDGEECEMVKLNCDVSNKFSLLHLGDST